MPATKAPSTLKQVKPEEVLVSWSAPSRPFRRHSREFYIKLIAFAGLFGVILYLIEGFMPVILIISLVFLFYIMSTVEPNQVDYKITTDGLDISGKKIDWEELGRFWFVQRLNTEILTIETFKFPGRLELIINPDVKKSILDALSKNLVHEEIPQSTLDRASNWLTKRVSSN